MNTLTVLISALGLCFAAATVESATPDASPAPAADCSTVILNMADCLSYVTEGSTVKKPEGSCCSGLKTVLKSDAECLCEGFKNSAQLGVTLNVTKALGLPTACGVSAPPLSDCGLSIGTGAAPAVSPVGSPTSMATPNEIAPAPAPGTSGSAALIATAIGSLVSALVVASSFSFI